MSKRSKGCDADDLDIEKELAWVNQQKKETDEYFKKRRLTPRPPRNSNEPPRKSDEELAMEYLAGYVVNQPDGRVSFHHLEPGSERECEAGRAVTRLLRGFTADIAAILAWREDPRRRASQAKALLIQCRFNDAAPMILTRLAALLDRDHTAEGRELVIQERSRGGGQSPNHARDVEIARGIAAEINDGHAIEPAINFAMEHYGVERSTVMRAWKKRGKAWLLKRGDLN